MVGFPYNSKALVRLGSTTLSSSAMKKKIILGSYEDEMVTAIVVVLLVGMLLAYLCLCCHVWGLHVRLYQLMKSLRSNSENRRNNRNTEREDHDRPSISVPVEGRSIEYLTPPPRYSLVNDSLPTYNCALIRMLDLLRGPVCLRILVYVNPGLNISNSNNRTALSRNDVDVVTPVDSTAGALSNRFQVSETSDNICSFLSDLSNPEHSVDPINSCERAPVSSVTTRSSCENDSIPLHSVLVSDQTDDAGTSGSQVVRTVSSPHSVVNSVTYSAATCTERNTNSFHRQHSPHSLSLPSTSTDQECNTAVTSTSSVKDLPPVPCKKDYQERNQSISTPNDSFHITSSISSNSMSIESPLASSTQLSHIDTRSPENSIKLLMKGIGNEEQVVYALQKTANCYVANWPLPARNFLISDSLEVMVDGRAVEDMYLEFLNVDGRRIGLTQLLPSPRSSSVSLLDRSTLYPSPFSPHSLSTPPLPPLSHSTIPPPRIPPPYHP